MKKTDLIENRGITSKDLFNTIGGTTLDKMSGKTIEVSAVAIGKDVSVDTGELVKVGILRAVDGSIITTISEVAIQSISNLVDYMEDENLESVTVSVNKQKANSGREFITLTMV